MAKIINKQTIRQKAEAMIDLKDTQAAENLEKLSLNKAQNLVHELEVHQIELELQNEELLKTQEELEKTKKRYFDLYDMAPIGYCTLNENGFIEEVNLAMSDLLGYNRDKLILQPLSHFILSQDQDIYYLFRKSILVSQEQEECELRVLKADNTSCWVYLSATRENNMVRLVIKDIRERKEYENSLKNTAHYDQLTKLPNRVLLRDRLENGMMQMKRNNQHLAVIFLDLDGFKEVNDTYGHDVGDKLLIGLAKEMKKALREGDTLARVGGDEFVAVLFDLEKISDALPIIIRLLEASSKNISVDNEWIQVSASLGVTFSTHNKVITADLLLRQADQAMYQAKLSGKNRYHFFNEEENNLIAERFEGIEQVRKALKNEELILYYQPKINMRTGEIIGAEALMRWQHPQKGLVPPLEFLPVLEGHSLSINVGEWVLHTTMSQIKSCQEEGINIVISVNIGARQLLEDNFVERLVNILSQYPSVDPSMLELEVLETSRLEDIAIAKEVMNACIELGVTFSLDDFGTGYSSLIYLKQLPIKQIKIDQSFVQDMLDDPNDLSILEAIISLGKAFHRSVIAEGVETSAHAAALLGLDCELGQGNEIAHPMPAIEFNKWLKEYTPNVLWKKQNLLDENQRELLFLKIHHRAWVQNIKAIITEQRSEYIEGIHECTFGKWLDNGGRDYLGSNYQSIDIKHKNIHILADKLLALHQDGKSTQALAGMDELYSLRDELVTQLLIE